MYTAEYFIQKLNLERHVEGGCFKRVYESRYQMLIPGFSGHRFIGTTIHFLLEKNDFSTFHRLKADETWSFNYGSPLTLYVINQDGKLEKIILGDPEQPIFQVTIHANQWFAAEINDKSSFSLVSCFLCPGFDYSDFEMAERNALINEYPHLSETIKRLTRVL